VILHQSRSNIQITTLILLFYRCSKRIRGEESTDFRTVEQPRIEIFWMCVPVCALRDDIAVIKIMYSFKANGKESTNSQSGTFCKVTVCRLKRTSL